MAGPKQHRLLYPLWKYAENHCNAFIAGYGIDRAEIIAKLTLEKIRAQKKSLERKYGRGDELKCKKHPKYKAIRRPRVACGVCWDMYDRKHKNEKK